MICRHCGAKIVEGSWRRWIEDGWPWKMYCDPAHSSGLHYPLTVEEVCELLAMIVYAPNESNV